jgi:hypothetical protein
MIMGCFYMSIPVTWSEYSFMCPDYCRSHLHGHLDLLHVFPYPTETPTIQNIVIVLPLLLCQEILLCCLYRLMD